MDQDQARAVEHTDGADDHELLDQLRQGDDRAYEALWVRHVAAARRVAVRIAPADADDLVSEAFLAVYHQVRELGQGPRVAFRPYLFAVIRNTAIRWHNEQSRLVHHVDLDVPFEDDGMQQVEGERDARMLLDAFRALPDRWQRVIWLSEIEGASRPVIASQLGIRPNAVSALRRRAIRGLRSQWLGQHVPVALKDNPDHVGGALPKLVSGGLQASERTAALQHLDECAACARVLEDVWDARKQSRRSGLPVAMLGAVGVAIPAVSTAWVVLPAGVASAALLVSAAAFCTAAVLAGAIGLGAISRIDATPEVPSPGRAASVAPDSASLIPVHTPQLPVAEPEPPLQPAPAPVAPSAPPATPDSEPPIEFGPNESGDGARIPVTPRVAPPMIGVIAPGIAAAPEVIAQHPSSTYLAPLLTGSVAAGDSVVVELQEQMYAADVDDTGAWTFDLRGFALSPGIHSAEVWSVAANGAASAARSVDFTIQPLVHNWTDEYVSLTLQDSSADGFVFTVSGPPEGAVCVWSDSGQTATIQLDDSGDAIRRIRFLGYGIYVMNLYPCVDGFDGPSVDRNVMIRQGSFDPWGTELPEWEIDEP